MNICRLDKHSADEVADLWRNILATSVLPMGGSWTVEKVKALVTEPNLVAIGWRHEQTGEMVGFLVYRRLTGVSAIGGGEKIADSVSEIEIWGVRPEFQKKGLAGQCLTQFLSAELPTDTLWLEVHEGNKPAINIYNRCGFIKTGERKNYYSDGGTAILMEFKKRS
jgi:ribosomal-protein-alanine N-acetyltransferase